MLGVSKKCWLCCAHVFSETAFRSSPYDLFACVVPGFALSITSRSWFSAPLYLTCVFLVYISFDFLACLRYHHQHDPQSFNFKMLTSSLNLELFMSVLFYFWKCGYLGRLFSSLILSVVTLWSRAIVYVVPILWFWGFLTTWYMINFSVVCRFLRRTCRL